MDSSDTGYAAFCADKVIGKGEPKRMEPTNHAGPIPTLLRLGYFAWKKPMPQHAGPLEGKTSDWRAGCGRTASPVRREGASKPIAYLTLESIHRILKRSTTRNCWHLRWPHHSRNRKSIECSNTWMTSLNPARGATLTALPPPQNHIGATTGATSAPRPVRAGHSGSSMRQLTWSRRRPMWAAHGADRPCPMLRSI